MMYLIYFIFYKGSRFRKPEINSTKTLLYILKYDYSKTSRAWVVDAVLYHSIS